MAKRIEFSVHGGPEVMQYVNYTPKDPAPNQVLVSNIAIGINYIDTYVRSGLYPPPYLPSGLGTEAAGIVEKIGSSVGNINVGDRVVYALSALGAYSEYHCVSADKVAKLPNAISYKQAAASFLKGLTVYYLLHITYRVKPGEIILFHAGVGRIACQWAKALDVKLIGTVGSTEKADQALRDGAWATINYREDNIAQRVLELTGGEKVNVVYDSVGKATWLDSLDCIKPRGLMVSFGNSSGAITGVDIGILNQKGGLFVTRPSLGHYINTQQQLQNAANELFSMMASGAINANVVAQQQFPLKDAVQAHQALESRTTSDSCLLIP